MNGRALGPELERLAGEIEAVSTRATTLCGGLNEDQLVWRPTEEQWSIAENLIHLKVTAHTFLPAADYAIERAKRRQLFSQGPFKLGLIGRLLVWYVEPPPHIRLPAPKVLRPVLKGGAKDALSEFLDAQRLMKQRLESANGLDLRKAKVISPLASYIRMSLLAFFAVYTGHGRRHLWQASNVRKGLEEGKQ